MLLVRFLQSVIVFSILGIILVLLQAGASSSGIVVFTADYQSPGSTQALSFERPEISRVFQANLQSGRPDYYTFKATSGTFLKAQLNTLRLPGQDNFKPSLALFGPGLPVPTTTELNSLAFSLPPGAGLLVSVEEKDDPTSQIRLDEPWTQANYWERQSLLNELPQTGIYYLAVFSRTKVSGKYTLAVGDHTEAGLRETLTFPVTWARTRLWFNDYWWPGFVLFVVSLFLAGLLYLYLSSVRRQLRTVRINRINRRRSALLREITHSPSGLKNRRAAQTARYASRPRPLAAPVRQPTSIITALELPLVSSIGLASAATETVPAEERVPVVVKRSRVLSGSEWEALILPAAAGINGHKQLDAALNKASEETAYSLRQDGLSRWGQRLRPDQPGNDRSGK